MLGVKTQIRLQDPPCPLMELVLTAEYIDKEGLLRVQAYLGLLYSYMMCNVEKRPLCHV